MGTSMVLAVWLMLLPQSSGPAYGGPPSRTPLRNSFATAAESVIDTADAVEISAPRERYAPEMTQLQATYDQLQRVAEDDREKEVAHALNDLVFAIAACHLQAEGGTPTQTCEAQVQRARLRSMEALGKHKTASGWIDGAPAGS
jgi:hypothetical protein